MIKKLLLTAVAVLAATALLAPVAVRTQAPLIPTHTRISWYSALTNAAGSFHVKTPGTLGMRITLISGGGGGMGSQANMIFGPSNPIPYGLYGDMGTESCWDTHPQKQVSFNGPTVFWPNHPFNPNLDADNPIFFTTTGSLPTGGVMFKVYYVRTPSITPNTFEVADVPYNATSKLATPSNPYIPPPSNWTGVGTGAHYAFGYKRCVMGGGGGGIIGDQPIPGHSVGWRFATFDTMFINGAAGSCQLGAGGTGAFLGAAAQFGVTEGNLGSDQSGSGGGGGGMGANYTQPGPCGGASGGIMKIWLKPADFTAPIIYLLAGKAGEGGIAGPGGWAGGRGGHGLVLVEEDLP